MLKNKWREVLIAAICVAAVTVTIILYSISTTQHIFDESAEHLEELAIQVNAKFAQTVETNRNLLNSWKHLVNETVDSMQNSVDSDEKRIYEKELDDFFSAQDAQWNITDIYFISEDETELSDLSESEFNWSVQCRSWKNRSIDEGKTTLKFVRSINELLNQSKGGILCEDADGKTLLMFAVNYQETDSYYDDISHTHEHRYLYNGFRYRAVGIGFDTNDMRSLLTVDAFDGKGICYIVRNKGAVVLQAGSLHEEPITDYLAFLGNKNLVDIKGTTIEKITKDWSTENEADKDGNTQRSDTFLFYDKHLKIEYYMTYRPVGFDDWMFLGLVPSDAVNGSMNAFRTQTILVMAIIFILIGAVTVWFAIVAGKRKIKEKESEIKSRENLFDMLTYNSNDIFVLFSPDDFTSRYVSTNITDVLGLDIEEVRADVHCVLQATTTKHAAFTSKGLKGLPSGRTWEVDMPMMNVLTKEEHWFCLTLYHTSYNGEDSFIMMLSDRTKEHNMSVSLEEALQITKSANEAKSNFLSNMSHDIRTPMNAIIGFATLLGKDADNPDKVREYVRKISFSSQHLLSLINDILDMSKIESGKTTLNIEEFDLSELFEELYTMMSPQAKAKGQHLRITTKGHLPERVCADRLRINQVLINLLSNAIKYTPNDGRIELGVEALDKNIPNHSHLRITVRDTGIGMSKEFTKEIFEPFAREVNSKNKNVQGTGLGMAITKNIVDLMGGTISVESEIDKGSVFTLELELAIAGKHDEDETHFWIKHNITRVLVVDNDEDICSNVQSLMEETGVDVQCALSGMEAIEMVSEAADTHRDFNIILLDWKMPEMDGIETARRIRERIGHDVPIMVLTSYNFDEIEEEARSVGIDLFLPKPFFVSNFRNAIEKLKVGEEGQGGRNADEISMAGLKVLAAEDNEINAEILADLMEIEEVKCDIVVNGKEAFETFKASAPGQYDVIFMDVQMPIMNGYEATAAIRACKHPMAKKIPIIAMTANAFEDDVKQALDSGMNAHLAKPIDMDKLKLIVDGFMKPQKTVSP